jgi:glycine cleavage system transcriptional repressor
MSHVAVSAIGSDRAGIVASVTGVLVQQGCNLEDTSMSILRGHFAMMLIVAVPDGVTAEALELALAPAARALDLVLVVRAIDDDVPRSPEGASWTVSVYGADRPGIVHRVASVLAEDGVNIVDLTTRIIGEAERPVYAMFLDVTLPDSLDAGEWQQRLSALAKELGVSCSAHPADTDIL